MMAPRPTKRNKALNDRDTRILAAFESIAKSLKTLEGINIRTEKRMLIMLTRVIEKEGVFTDKAELVQLAKDMLLLKCTK